MARNNPPARRAERAEAAASRQSSAPVLVDEQPAAATLPDRVIRRLCWRARGWAWRESATIHGERIDAETGEIIDEDGQR